MLNPELNRQIEESPLTAGDKLVARVAVAALETIQDIAAKVGKPIEAIEPADVVTALSKDAA